MQIYNSILFGSYLLLSVSVYNCLVGGVSAFHRSNHKKNKTAPGIPKRSPIHVLAGPVVA